MGLDAFVPCRCWEDGLTTEPPVDRSRIFRSDGMLDLRLPYDAEIWRSFDAWTHAGCGHADMDVAAEHIGNWSEYRQFQWALGAVGWSRFPVLRRVLPESNGGEVSPKDAAGALRELEDFTTAGLIGIRTELYDDSGALVATQNPAYGAHFVIGPGYRVGVDENGLFVTSDGEELFRALRIGQRAADDGRAWLTDLDHPARGETLVPTAIPGGAGRLQTRSRAHYPDDFAHTVQALAKVFTASVDIGRPVHWT
jgi:hypothetical protein